MDFDLQKLSEVGRMDKYSEQYIDCFSHRYILYTLLVIAIGIFLKKVQGLYDILPDRSWFMKM